MGALGAVGGIGGLGSYGDAGSSGGDDAGMESDAAAASLDSWYDSSSSSVMATSGDVDGSTVQLDDADLSSQYVLGDLQQQPDRFPLPPAGGQEPPQAVGDAPEVPEGVGDAPSAEVVSQVAALYAANSGDGGSEMPAGW